MAALGEAFKATTPGLNALSGIYKEGELQNRLLKSEIVAQEPLFPDHGQGNKFPPLEVGWGRLIHHFVANFTYQPYIQFLCILDLISRECLQGFCSA
jgi:hypothetical protein